MATTPDSFDRDLEGDAAARAWAAEIRRLAEAGELHDETDEIRDLLEEERARNRR